MKNKYSRIVSSIFLAVVLIFGSVMTANAQEPDTEDSIAALAQEAAARTTENYLIIKDIETGEETRINLGDSVVTVENIGNGIRVTDTVDLEEALGKIPMPMIDQSVANTLSGWRGTVSITYTDDGTWASLNYITGNWRRVSGSYNMTNAGATYGQSLGTNSRSASTTFGSQFSANTTWPKGKYGRGHFLCGNISGRVNGKIITVVCNHNL